MTNPPSGSADPNIAIGQITQALGRMLGSIVPGTTDDIISGLDSVVGKLQLIVGSIKTINSLRQDNSTVSELQKQIYLQFLAAESQYLKGHRTSTATALAAQTQLDLQKFKQKLAQMADLLSKVFLSGGADAFLQPLLAKARSNTFKSNIDVIAQPSAGALGQSLDKLLLWNENLLMMKLLDVEIARVYKDTAFDAKSSSDQFAAKWDNYLRSQKSRMETVKQVWTKLGGGRDVDKTAPYEAAKAVADFYNNLLDQIANAKDSGFFGLGFGTGAAPAKQ